MNSNHEMRRRYLWRRHQLEEFRYASFFKRRTCLQNWVWLHSSRELAVAYARLESHLPVAIIFRLETRPFIKTLDGHLDGAFIHGAGFHVISEDLRSFLKANDSTMLAVCALRSPWTKYEPTISYAVIMHGPMRNNR